MRFTRISPESSDELRDAILEDLEALEPGMRCVATRVPVSGRGVIDLLASDERGRLAVVSFCLDAEPGAIAVAIDQWDWTVANMGLLRALVPVVGLDLSLSPRVILVCRSIDENVLRFAACLPTPGIEIYEAAMVQAGERRGLLVDRIPTRTPEVAATDPTIESALEGIQPDDVRALTRRLFAELSDSTGSGASFSAQRTPHAFDIHRDGRNVASVAATRGGLSVRFHDPVRVLSISDDTGCRDAVRLLTSPLDQESAPARGEGRDTVRAPAAAALTAEEIAEFESLRSNPPAMRDSTAQAAAGSAAGLESPPAARIAVTDARGETETAEPPAVRILRTGFMEN